MLLDLQLIHLLFTEASSEMGSVVVSHMGEFSQNLTVAVKKPFLRKRNMKKRLSYAK